MRRMAQEARPWMLPDSYRFVSFWPYDEPCRISADDRS